MATTSKTAKQLTPTAQAEVLLARYTEVGAELDALKKGRLPLEQEYQTLRNKLQEWADNNQSEFADAQSIKLANGTFGYRNGTEKLDFDFETALPEPQRTEAMVAALKKVLPTALVVNYDERMVVNAWAVMPKLRTALKDLVAGVKRGQSFVITTKKPD